MSSSTDTFAGAAQALAAALLAATVDPADAVRLLSQLAGFTPSAPTPTGAIGSSMATMQSAAGDCFRRAAVVALSRAVATYQPASADDAVNVRTQVCALLDAEITVAGDQGEDATYKALRALRRAVVQDLNARGAGLPAIRTVAFNAALPALVVAQRLYRDPNRVDELITQANPPHPCFMPLRFKALSQ